MAAYRAMVEGRNFLLGIDGKVRRCGFYQTVFLQCTDPSEVESIAVRAVKGDIELNQMTRNDLGDPPMLYLDGFEEIDDSEPLPTAKGRSYYCGEALVAVLEIATFRFPTNTSLGRARGAQLNR